MRISLCYIVKDELIELERSLQSIARVADEIIIGATFGPAEKAVRRLGQRYGAQIYTVLWEDDFAAARNSMLVRATGDWIIFLDADEYFTSGSAEKMRAVLDKIDADALLIPMENIDLDQKEKVQLELLALRLFKPGKNRRYIGRIHEELCDGDVPVCGRVIGDEDLKLVHTGYSSGMTAAKAERNLSLLLAELANTDRPERLYGYIAEAYDGLGQAEDALRYAEMAIRQGRQKITYASRCHRIVLANFAKGNYTAAERLAAVRRAVEDFPELPEFQAELAQCLAANYELEDAIAAGELALLLWQEGPQSAEPVQFTEEMAVQLTGGVHKWQQLAARAKQLKISSCLIMKDGAADLPAFLAGAKVYSEEIICVDTGSVDNSCELASSQGVRLYKYTWENDFAKAKNYALEKVSRLTDWIAVLDVDEHFLFPGRLKYYLAMLEQDYPEAEAVNGLFYNLEEANGQELNRCVGGPRLLKNNPGIRFQGAIHEMPVSARGEELAARNMPDALAICHYGYSQKRIQAKAWRNLALLLQEEKSAPREGIEALLAETYDVLQDYERVAAYAEKFLLQGGELPGGEVHLWELWLGALWQTKAALPKILWVTEEALKRYPEAAGLHGEKSLVLAALDRLEEAAGEFSKAKQLSRAGRSVTDSYFMSLEPRIWCALGEAALRAGLEEEAWSYLGKLRGNTLEKERNLLAVAELLQEKQAAFQREYLDGAAGEKLRLAIIADILGENGYIKLAELLTEREPGTAELVHEVQGDPLQVIKRLQKPLAVALHNVLRGALELAAQPREKRNLAAWRQVGEVLSEELWQAVRFVAGETDEIPLETGRIIEPVLVKISGPQSAVVSRLKRRLGEKQKIVSYVIVKNEAEDIQSWLEKARLYSDEILVVDTGSTDETVELAEKAGARVCHFSWSNDFAAARNYALAQLPADTDWIIALDADESFFAAEGLRDYLAQVADETDALVAVAVNVDEATDKVINTCMTNERILRAASRLKYVGAVHEHTLLPDGRAPKLATLPEELCIRHTGYSPARMQAKGRRNLALLQERIKQEGNKGQLDGYLAEAYFALGDYEKALQAAATFLQSDYTDRFGGNLAIWHVLLQSMRELKYENEAFIDMATTAIRAMPEAPELYLERSMGLRAMGRLAAAAEDILFAARLAQQDSGGRLHYLSDIPKLCERLLAELRAAGWQSEQLE